MLSCFIVPFDATELLFQHFKNVPQLHDEQFKRFYWPTLKAVIIGLAEEDIAAVPFCEGSYNSRIEYLKELPKSSSFWLFDRTDLGRTIRFSL
jgi:hypothetical protein